MKGINLLKSIMVAMWAGSATYAVTATTVIRPVSQGPAILDANSDAFRNDVNQSARERGAWAAKASETIPWSEIGAKAGANYKGDGLAVLQAKDGARLRCVFQRLEGEASSDGSGSAQLRAIPLPAKQRAMAKK